MFASQYYDSIKDILDTVYASEKDKIERAGRCVADTIMGDGLVHGFGCGHSHMLMEELFYRADRLVVMYKGKIVGELNPRTTTVQEVGRLMMGVGSHE